MCCGIQSVRGGALSVDGGAVFLDGGFHGFAAFAGALLDAAQQLVLLAFDELQVIVRELGPLLDEIAFDDVPFAFDSEVVHALKLAADKSSSYGV